MVERRRPKIHEARGSQFLARHQQHNTSRPTTANGAPTGMESKYWFCGPACEVQEPPKGRDAASCPRRAFVQERSRTGSQPLCVARITLSGCTSTEPENGGKQLSRGILGAAKVV